MIVWYNEITDNVLSTYVHCWVLLALLAFYSACKKVQRHEFAFDTVFLVCSCPYQFSIHTYTHTCMLENNPYSWPRCFYANASSNWLSRESSEEIKTFYTSSSRYS